MSTSEPGCVCAELPSRFDDAYLTDVTPVAANADLDGAFEGETWVSYRCLGCGQWWRDGFGDDRALRKVDHPDERAIPASRTPTPRRRARKSPQEKKRQSLEKDSRNAYGENAKASRKNIPRAKAWVNRANRRADSVALIDATGALDEELAGAVEQVIEGRRRKVWRKWPDEPLGRRLARKAGTDSDLPFDPSRRQWH